MGHPGRMLGACGMQRCHQEALKKNRVMLAKQLVLKELIEHMIEKDIITAEMMEMIQVGGSLRCQLCFCPSSVPLRAAAAQQNCCLCSAACVLLCDCAWRACTKHRYYRFPK